MAKDAKIFTYEVAQAYARRDEEDEAFDWPASHAALRKKTLERYAVPLSVMTR